MGKKMSPHRRRGANITLGLEEAASLGLDVLREHIIGLNAMLPSQPQDEQERIKLLIEEFLGKPSDPDPHLAPGKA
ncbi:MAG: hypothetical protein RLZZ416_824 [Candidatus Parcubacteria bacterium]|jgi:hypothetical protein